MTNASKDADELLEAWRSGDDQARDALFELFYQELASLASYLLRGEQQQISLLTGDLVNEAMMRLLRSSELDVVDRSHLLALSARAMRRVLVDAARRRNRHKRRGLHVSLSVDQTPAEEDQALEHDLLALERALERLARIDTSRAEVVEMRYFGGLTIEQVAAVMKVSPATVKRIWMAARLWLRNEIQNDD